MRQNGARQIAACPRRSTRYCARLAGPSCPWMSPRIVIETPPSSDRSRWMVVKTDSQVSHCGSRRPVLPDRQSGGRRCRGLALICAERTCEAGRFQSSSAPRVLRSPRGEQREFERRRAVTRNHAERLRAGSSPAPVSGSSARKGVGVRVPASAPNITGPTQPEVS